MAIDTAEKRKSVAGVSGLYNNPSVTPNASKDSQWRQQVGQSFSGITTGGSGTATGGAADPIFFLLLMS